MTICVSTTLIAATTRPWCYARAFTPARRTDCTYRDDGRDNPGCALRGDIMSKVDDAANKVKRGADKAAAATKDAAKAAGNKVKNAGDKIKEQGR